MSEWFDSTESLMVSLAVAQVKIKQVLDKLLEQNPDFADKHESFIENFDKLFGQLNSVIFDNIQKERKDFWNPSKDTTVKEFHLKKE